DPVALYRPRVPIDWEKPAVARPGDLARQRRGERRHHATAAAAGSAEHPAREHLLLPQDGVTVLVTGACGNVGRYTVDAFLEAGARVRAMVHVQDEVRRWTTRDVEIVRADVRVPETLRAALRDTSVVVPLAYIIPPLAFEQPEEARRVNVD